MLTHLELHSCMGLEQLPQLPASVQTIIISQGSALQSLPSLPESLKKLELSECSSLQVGTQHAALLACEMAILKTLRLAAVCRIITLQVHFMLQLPAWQVP